MLEKVKNSDGSVTYHRGSQTVRAWPLIHSYWEGQPCYVVRLQGDIDFYFGAGMTILHRVDHDEMAYVWYIPDEYFVKYADDLIKFGGWKTDEADNVLIEKVLSEQS